MTAVVKECADLGFEEIVLDDVQFRITAGRSALYMSRGKTAMRAALRRSMLSGCGKTAVGDEVTLSIALPSQLLENTVNGAVGWDLSSIAQRVDRIYMDAADQTAADSARAAVSALRTDVDGTRFL